MCRNVRTYLILLLIVSAYFPEALAIVCDTGDECYSYERCTEDGACEIDYKSYNEPCTSSVQCEFCCTSAYYCWNPFGDTNLPCAEDKDNAALTGAIVTVVVVGIAAMLGGYYLGKRYKDEKYE